MRYAVYYAPIAGSLLHRLGSSWLGRDALTGEPIAQPPLEGLREATADAHRYGFHATLKAPFKLREGVKRVELGDAMALLASRLDSVPSCRLELALVDGFLALVPANRHGPLAALAERCVRELDKFRQPADEDELRRRGAAWLTPRQDRLLREWGYPYVLDEFRFHLTLTRRLEEGEVAHFMDAAAEHFDRILRTTISVDAVTIFAEPHPGGDFRIEERFPLRREHVAWAAT
jgi:putative phosphonate metabolism protein